ncbi:M16 family metallopeptidase [Gallaecimonas xiamenensis]|uniref:Peptidase M16-like protein n=1 Tax=Gallaecimonas xiamenensis 3-C-1 TaxID=745411 RepID=K2J7H9_9GAMM|nr:pitrilysin family protein [Gallaecimonas xiamenensis]EKE71083.1 peptidase M16-like protein [Gallaecimonas xiamenensis 3-C-1]
MRKSLGCLLGLSLAATQVQAGPEEVNRFTLDNGMEVLVVEDHSIPNANMYLFWKVGSRNERPGITGLSHFFEHMMFNGAKKYGPGQFDKVMEAAGGANNAYTSEDVTVYTDWFPAQSLETIFDLEADRIAHLAIDPKRVASEREVVASERTTGLENSNWRTLSEEVKGVAFRAHPYSWSVIGHESDIKAWRQEDLESYHRTYYAPNNALVVVAGDVTTAKVKELAKRYFAPIPAQAPPLPVVTVEPQQKGERRLYVHKASVTSPNLMVAYHVPATKDADTPALQLLVSILAGGKSGRLKKALIDEQKLATDVEAYLPDTFDPNLFYLYAVATPGTDQQALEKGLLAEVARIRDQGVSVQELDKARNLMLMQSYGELETINGKANALGTYALYYGDYRKLYTLGQDFDKVSPADIQRVAKAYLTKANRTVGVLGSKEDLE